MCVYMYVCVYQEGFDAGELNKAVEARDLSRAHELLKAGFCPGTSGELALAAIKNYDVGMFLLLRA